MFERLPERRPLRSAPTYRLSAYPRNMWTRAARVPLPDADRFSERRNGPAAHRPAPVGDNRATGGNRAAVALLAREADAPTSAFPDVAVTTPGDALERQAEAVSTQASEGYAGPVPAAAGLARQVTRATPPPLPPVIGNALTQGRPLPVQARGPLESALGADLSGLRVHTGPAAAMAAASVGARAFTLGHAVVLGAGESPSDGPLLAHEATHALQPALRMGLARLAVGNRATAALIAREPTPAPAPVPLLPGGATSENLSDLPDFLFVPQVLRLGSAASEALRFEAIDRILGYFWVGPLDEYDLEALWNSFGRTRIETLLTDPAQRKRWDSCLDRGAELWDIAALRGYRTDFERDVRKVVNSYLNDNRAFVEQEQVALGLRTPEPGRTGPSTEEQEDRVRQIQTLIESIEMMQWLREQLLLIPVGVELPGAKRLEDVYDVIHGIKPPGQEQGFRPGWPPEMPWDNSYLPPPHGRKYADVQDSWDLLDHAGRELADISPVAFAALTTNRLGEVSADRDPATARTVMAGLLATIHGNITRTIESLASDDLDWRELQVIHARLFAGDTSRGTADWSRTPGKEVATDVVEDFQDREWWLSLGLGTLAAAAFVFSAIATGGLATAAWAAVGVGIGATQAAMSWERYDDLKTAAGATARSDLMVVSEEQVRAARLQAILDTAFALIDIAQLAKPVGRLGAALANRGVRASAQAAAEQGLRGVRQLGQAEAKGVIERSIREVGLDATARGTGMSVDELRTLVGSSDVLDQAVARAASLGAALEPAALRTQLATLGESIGTKRLSQTEADQLVSAAIDRFGPAETLRAAGGWEKLAKTLGNDAEAGKRLVAWRDSAYADLRQFIDPNSEGLIQRTGRQGAFTNDLDFSTMGADAVGNADKARTFLAGRIGASGDELGKLLDAGIMTDPRRMHLYDLLSDPVARESVAKRAAAMEDELMWAKRLADAKGDELMQSSIRRQMGEIGVREVPWKQLTEGERTQLASAIDGLHKQFDAAKQAGSAAEANQLAAEIVEKQALLNASTPGAYATGGAVRRWVSEREWLPGFGAADSPAPLTAQRLTDIGNQMVELHHAADGLAKASGSTEIAGQLKKLGKYGSRLTETAERAFGDKAAKRVLGAADQDLAAMFESLGERFSALQKAMESGQLAKLSRNEILAVRASAFDTLARLEEKSVAFLTELRARAGVTGISGELDAVQSSVRAHLALVRATSELKRRVATEVTQQLAAAAAD